MTPDTSTTTPETTFESALARLESLADDLERGTPGLAESLAKYEQGVHLLAHCHGLLDRAEQSVNLLAGVDPEGRPLTTPFDPDAPPDAPAARPPGKPRKRATPKPETPDDGFIPF